MLQKQTQRSPGVSALTLLNAAFAGEVSRVHKLKKEDHEALIGFSSLGRGEQMVSLAGQLLAIALHQSLIQPNPSIPAYRDTNIGPKKLLLDMVHANPAWGFPVEMKDEKYATDALGTVISVILANKCNLVKNILGSLGSDPENSDADLLRPDAMNIINLAKAILVKLKVKSVPLDIHMCGRVAVLRQLVLESDDNKYWSSVDKDLVSVRTKYPDPVLQSRFIKRYILYYFVQFRNLEILLDPDFQTYGAVDLTSLATPSVRTAGSSTAPLAPAAAHTSDNTDSGDN
ncbi:hypothetical protein B0H14DRAFT_3501639 [Mycena olivaceomarginata]|nr:hypothetical protein B0H14DRAFT_3501639 [Mycena olivaceomarginata]